MRMLLKDIKNSRRNTLHLIEEVKSDNPNLPKSEEREIFVSRIYEIFIKYPSARKGSRTVREYEIMEKNITNVIRKRIGTSLQVTLKEE